MTVNTPDTTLVLSIISLDKNRASFSANFVEVSDEMGITFDYDVTQTINTNRNW